MATAPETFRDPPPEDPIWVAPSMVDRRAAFLAPLAWATVAGMLDALDALDTPDSIDAWRAIAEPRTDVRFSALIDGRFKGQGGLMHPEDVQETETYAIESVERVYDRANRAVFWNAYVTDPAYRPRPGWTDEGQARDHKSLPLPQTDLIRAGLLVAPEDRVRGLFGRLLAADEDMALGALADGVGYGDDARGVRRIGRLLEPADVEPLLQSPHRAVRQAAITALAGMDRDRPEGRSRREDRASR